MHCQFSNKSIENYENLRNRVVCGNALSNNSSFEDFCRLGMASWIYLRSSYYMKVTVKSGTEVFKKCLPNELVIVIANMIEGKKNAPIT